MNAGGDFGNGETLLFARVTVAEGDRVFELRILAKRIEIDRDAERRAYLILAAVSFAYIAIIIKLAHKIHLQIIINLSGFFH